MKHHDQTPKTVNGFKANPIACIHEINYEHHANKLDLTNQNNQKLLGSNQQQIINCLRIIRGENIGNFTFWRLIEIFGDLENAVREAESFFAKLNSKKQLKLASLKSVEEEFEKVEKYGARIISTFDDCYPKYLRLIHDHPPILTIIGDEKLLEKKLISIVGARNCSFNGSCTAKKIALEFGDNSFTTISGLAKGIDSAVHEASILSGTIAVIAGGINNLYPKENHKLYQQISEYGLIISEMPFNTPAKSNYFIRRNRIISGLSPALIVVEAGIRSGSLTTAKFALEQNREVFACAGSPFDARCYGVNQLIKDGANIINDITQLVSDINLINCQFAKSYDCEIKDNQILEKKPINILNQDSQINLTNQDNLLGFTNHKNVDEIDVNCQIKTQNEIKFFDQNNHDKIDLYNFHENFLFKDCNQDILLDVNQEIIAENFFDQDLQDEISENNSYKNQSIEIDKISQDILSKINNYPISIDEIIFQLNISPKLVNIALVQLELNKRIIVFQGKVSLEIT